MAEEQFNPSPSNFFLKDTLRLLEGMDNLSHLTVRHRPPRQYYQPSPPLEELISAAERILRTSKAPRRKELRIQQLEETPSDDVIREETLFIVGGPR